MSKKHPEVDAYITHTSKEVRPILKAIKDEIAKRIPEAEETFSYKMPAFKAPKVFIYFAAFKNHIGVYPPVQNKTLQKKLKKYMNERGNLIFPLDEEVPVKLIGDVAKALWKQYKK